MPTLLEPVSQARSTRSSTNIPWRPCSGSPKWKASVISRSRAVNVSEGSQRATAMTYGTQGKLAAGGEE